MLNQPKILWFSFILNLFIAVSCNNHKASKENLQEPGLIILGTVQDGGSPHIACKKACCKGLFTNPDKTRKVVSLGVTDPQNKMTWLFEATPDMPEQMKALKNYASFKTGEAPDGIFLTHAHIGHYAGLMYLGKEAMGAKSIPIYAMPRMKTFLETNGPWSQLVSLKNILIHPIENNEEIVLSSHVKVRPILVPHRDEFSETVGFVIAGPKKKALFIPDINKWSLWDKNIIEEIAKVDYAFIDATFYDGLEINNRKMSEIPHPFVVETMELLKDLPKTEKGKIYFIHFNHTNPLLNQNSKEAKQVIGQGFHIAQYLQWFAL